MTQGTFSWRGEAAPIFKMADRRISPLAPCYSMLPLPPPPSRVTRAVADGGLLLGCVAPNPC